MIKMSDGLMLL